MMPLISAGSRPAGPGLPPEIMPPAVSVVLRRVLSALEASPDCPQGVIPMRVAPSDAERALLRQRKVVILEGLTEAGSLVGDDLKRTLLLLLAATRPWDGKGDAAAQVAIYQQACRDLPLWAVRATVKRFMSGPTEGLGIKWDSSRPPSSLEVAEASRRVRPTIRLSDGSLSIRATVLELKQERSQIDRVLAAEVKNASVTEEERKKVLAGFDKLRASLTSASVDREAAERRRAEMLEANQLVRARELKQKSCIAAVQAEIAALML